MKHTPGPWVATVRTNEHGGWSSPSQEVQIIGEATSELIAFYATDFAEYPDDGHNEANARLIAKAPEMYALLKMTVDAFGDDDPLIGEDAAKLLKEIDNGTE